MQPHLAPAMATNRQPHNRPTGNGLVASSRLVGVLRIVTTLSRRVRHSWSDWTTVDGHRRSGFVAETTGNTLRRDHADCKSVGELLY